jgi:putative transposase
MPTGLKRYYGNGDLHFLTCSCYHRQPWLASARRRDLFLQILEAARQRYRFVVVGYVAMPFAAPHPLQKTQRMGIPKAEPHETLIPPLPRRPF